MGYKIVRAILDFFFFIVFRLHVEGRENVPEKGAIIVAPNHKSYWDPPMIGVAFKTRIVHFMAKEELFKNPVFGWVIRQLGQRFEGWLSAWHISRRHPYQKRRPWQVPFRHGFSGSDDRDAHSSGSHCRIHAYAEMECASGCPHRETDPGQKGKGNRRKNRSPE